MSEQTAIAAIGLASSLGVTARQSCAAVRAGLTGLSALDAIDVLDEESGELLPLLGHAAAGGIVGNFQGVGRIIELSRLALTDICQAGTEMPDSPIPLLVGVGGDYYARHFLANELAEIGDSLHFSLDEIIEAESQSFKEHVNRKFISHLAKQVEFPIDVTRSRVLFGEQASVAKILAYAERVLSDGTIPAVLVGGVDSLVEEVRAQQLASLGLIKTPILDTGFFPGEAAAFLLLRKVAPEQPAMVIIRQIGFTDQGQHRMSGELAHGEVLAELMKSALSGNEDYGLPGLIIDSLNGDQWQSWDWGHAVSRLDGAIADVPQWHPAENFGEIGAATLPTMLCMAVRAFDRDYCHTNTVLTCVSAYDGGKATVLLTRKDQGGGDA